MKRFLRSVGLALASLSLLTGCNSVDAKASVSTSKLEFASELKGMEALEAKIERVKDADTVVVVPTSGKDAGKSVTVRELLWDGPESVKQGISPMKGSVEASQYHKTLLKTGKKVTIVFDKGNRQDRYGRYLAYIFIDGKSVQATMLRKGYGIVRYVYSGTDTLYKEFKDVEAVARKKKLGVWSVSGYVKQGKGKEQYYDMKKAY